MGCQADDLSVSARIDSNTPAANNSGSGAGGSSTQLMINRRSCGRDQRGSLVHALVPLPHGHAVDGDAATDTEFEVIIF